MNQAYNPPSSAARLQKRIGSLWPTVTIRSPYPDHPEWYLTERQKMLVEQVQAIPTMTVRARAAMLGVSPKMVQHTTTQALAWGLFKIVQVGKMGVKTLMVAKDWIVSQTPSEKVMATLQRWREAWRARGRRDAPVGVDPGADYRGVVLTAPPLERSMT